MEFIQTNEDIDLVEALRNNLIDAIDRKKEVRSMFTIIIGTLECS
jgi:hypothetical protein